MAKDQTDKSRFKSRFSDSFVTAAQYITELICEKEARQAGRDLSREFWKLPEWEKQYRNQIPTAYKLLKKYSAAAIINALNGPQAWKIYSLRAPHLIPLIETEQTIYEVKQQNIANAPVVERPDVTKPPRESSVKPSLRDRLKELE